MNMLPSDLLSAASSSGGGKIALILGAGCSVEAPAEVPAASACSKRIHARLLLDNVLQPGDCANPGDLAALADAVFARTGSQRDLVVRLVDEFKLKLTQPNRGYLLAAVLLEEGVIASVITLNFDLALIHALSRVGAMSVGVIERPEHMESQCATNVYYIHRSANEPDCDKWILRTEAIRSEWQNHWEDVVTTRVMAAPVVVFAGLGSPIDVLSETFKLLQDAIPDGRRVYQVDIVPREDSAFFSALSLPAEAYIQNGWCAFMDDLADRFFERHLSDLEGAIREKLSEPDVSDEDARPLLDAIRQLRTLEAGAVRASWFLDDCEYLSVKGIKPGLIADILVGVATLVRVSGAEARIRADGRIEFWRGDRRVAVVLPASGRGERGRAAIEARLSELRRIASFEFVSVPTAILFGTTDGGASPAPPTDIVRGEGSVEDIVSLPAFQTFHIAELRIEPTRIAAVIP